MGRGKRHDGRTLALSDGDRQREVPESAQPKQPLEQPAPELPKPEPAARDLEAWLSLEDKLSDLEGYWALEDDLWAIIGEKKPGMAELQAVRWSVRELLRRRGRIS